MKNKVLDRVTVLDIDNTQPVTLSNDEFQLLSLGPKFAVTPKVDDDLVHKIQVDVSKCAYKLRWKHHIDTLNPATGNIGQSDLDLNH